MKIKTLILFVSLVGTISGFGQSRNGTQSRNNYLICSYEGSISKKEFKQLSRYLLKIDFLNLKEKYIQTPGPNEEPYDDLGSVSFTIFYNDNYSKTIVDENLEIPKLLVLRKKIVDLKKKIKWTPIVNNLPN